MSRTARPSHDGAVSDTGADGGARRPFARRVLGSLWIWATVLLGIAVVLVVADPRVDLPVYLLAVIGGWLCGAAFVGVTLQMRSTRLGALIHVLGAVLAGVVLWAMVSIGPAIASILTGPGRAAFVVSQFASAPAAGWIWITLIGRVAMAKPFRAKPADPLVAPAWEHDGKEAFLRFRAVPLRLRSLTLAIAVVVVVVGGIATALLILTGDLAERLGPQVVMLVVGAGLALPAYLVMKAVLHRRTVDCELRIGPARLRLRAGGIAIETPLTGIELLRWRCDGDSARLEVRAGGRDLSLLAGLARVPKGTAPALPPLPASITRRLEAGGLIASRSRRGVTTFALESPAR